MIPRPFPVAAATVLLAIVTLGAQAQAPDRDAPEPPTQIQIDLSRILGEARAAARAGDLPRAIALYQVILRFTPQSRVARVELSLALAALGERERAARVLRDLDTEGLDPEILAVVDRLLGPDRLAYFFVPELFLDSNITGQTKEEIVLIDGVPFRLSDDARGVHGFGYGLTLGASYRVLDEVPRTTVTGGVTLRDFEGALDDEQAVFGSLSTQIPIGDRFGLTPSLSAIYRYEDWRPREFEAGLGLAATAAIGPVRNTLGGRYRVIMGQRNDGGSRLDRDVYEVSDTVSFGFDGVAFRFEERFTFQDWDNLPDQTRIEIDSGVDVTFADIPWAIPTIGGSFIYRDFRGPTPHFEVERLDREVEGHVELLVRDLEVFGSNPFIRYQYTDQSSNIALFDFEEHEVSIGVRAIVF